MRTKVFLRLDEAVKEEKVIHDADEEVMLPTGPSVTVAAACFVCSMIEY